MGRPPGNGGPTFRFNPVEVGEMEAILQAHNYAVPAREILEALAQRFSSSAERAGQVEVSGKQVWNWFQNRRYALRAKAARPSVPGQVITPPVPKGDEATVKTVPLVPHPQAPQPQPAPSMRSMPQLPHPLPAPSAAQSADRNALENFQMEFEAKSARDGAWYDVASFLSHRSLETGDPEALVRFSGFGPEEDEWVNIRKHVRQRSLPCESSECVAILPGDLILCFQEGKEQALYFDAHVLDAQRRRHDVRGCRCRILVRYDHDQSEEIVPLRKICRRPETDYRMQQLHAEFVNMNPQKTDIDSQVGNASKVVAAGGTTQMQTNTTMPTNFSVAGESTLQPSNLKVDAASGTTQMQMTNATTPTNVSVAGESKLQPFNLKIDVVGGPTQMQMITSTMPTNVFVAAESKLQPCNLKVGAAGGTPQVQMTTATMPTNVFVAGESKLQPSNLKVDAAGGTTQMQITTVTTPTNVSVAGESKFQPSNLKVDTAGQMQVDIANTLANVSVAGESKLQQSNLKVDASEGTPHMQMTTATTPANVSVAIESKLQPSNLKVDASGGTTQMQTTTATTPANISLTGESELQPSNMKVDASGETTEMQMTNATTPTNISVASESVKMFDAGNSTAVGDTNFSRTAVVNTTTADGPKPSMQQGEIEVKNSCSDNFV